MRRMAKVLLVLMIALTAIFAGYVLYIGEYLGGLEGSYLQGVSEEGSYPAFEYAAGIPEKWYRPQDLGIVAVWDYGGTLRVMTGKGKEPFPLQEEKPVFAFSNVFYQIEARYVTPGLSAEYSLYVWNNTQAAYVYCFDSGVYSCYTQLVAPIAISLSAGWIFLGSWILMGRWKRYTERNS